MKTKIFSLMTAFFLILVMTIPAFANSSSYGYTLDYRYLNGKSNGQFHYLTKGSASISGTNYVYSVDKGYKSTPNKLYFDLYKSDSFADSYYGSVTTYVDPNSNFYNQDSFSGYYDNVPTSGDFYMVIYKAADDGFNLKGSGNLKTR